MKLLAIPSATALTIQLILSQPSLSLSFLNVASSLDSVTSLHHSEIPHRHTSVAFSPSYCNSYCKQKIPLRLATAGSSTEPNKSSSEEPKELPTLSLYNSLTLTKEPLQPLSPSHVSMYTCGPTVYSYAHVGNFRAFLTYDVLKRALSYFGYKVVHICNLTDVDDKIIQRCREENVSLKELTGKYERIFMDDLEALNIVKADKYPRATEHIGEMVEMIKELEGNGLAYQSQEGSWYFRVDEKEGYGEQLVKLDKENLKQNASGIMGMQRRREEGEDGDDSDRDADEYDADKVGVRDFALWKAYKPDFDRDDATWDTEIGKGRPGWHLECSAMARKYLGDSIDLHCGGIDLKFPHHENEIAQSEGATGKKFCNCWLHNGFVNIGDEKMSKSKGNFLTLRSACPTSDDVRAYRYLVVSSQYRNPLSFTEAALGAAKGALKRMDNIMKQLNDALGESNMAADDRKSDITFGVEKELRNFEVALQDDLSMPRAAASLFSIIKLAEAEFKRFKKEQNDSDSHESITPLDLNGLCSVKEAIHQMDRVFGVFYEVPKEKKEDGSEIDEDVEEDGFIPDEVMKLVRSRTAAKEAKDWNQADLIREKIAELGFTVKDVKGSDPIVTRI